MLPGYRDREEDNKTQADQERSRAEEITPVLLIGGLSPPASSQSGERQFAPERLPGAVGLPSGDRVTRTYENCGIGEGIGNGVEHAGAPFERQV